MAKLDDLNSLQNLKIEVGLMKISNHENIVSCYEAFIYQKLKFFDKFILITILEPYILCLNI